VKCPNLPLLSKPVSKGRKSRTSSNFGLRAIHAKFTSPQTQKLMRIGEHLRLFDGERETRNEVAKNQILEGKTRNSSGKEYWIRYRRWS
jgi:hypothetical protein